MKKMIRNTKIWQQNKADKLEKRVKIEHFQYLEKYSLQFNTFSIDDNNVILEIKKRILAKKNNKEIHFIYLIENKNTWEYINIPPALESLGTLSLVDYSFLGQNELTSLVISEISAHKTNIFITCLSEANGLDKLFYSSLNEKNIISMTFNFDDQAGWKNIKNTCEFVDISLTSSFNSKYKYIVEKGRPLFFPEAANLEVFRPLDIEKKYDVVFIGALYGYRLQLIKYLKTNGINVLTFGPNTDNGLVSFEEMVQIWNQSKIVLGHGGIGYSHNLRNIKGRDFEVTATGACYITTRQKELGSIFTENENILFYDSLEELSIKIKLLLQLDDYRCKVASNASKFMRKHSWELRIKNILETCGII